MSKQKAHKVVEALTNEAKTRFRVPDNGGRPPDVRWTERRLIRMRPQTLKRLEKLSDAIMKGDGVTMHPMQIAGVLLENAVDDLWKKMK